MIHWCIHINSGLLVTMSITCFQLAKRAEDAERDYKDLKKEVSRYSHVVL